MSSVQNSEFEIDAPSVIRNNVRYTDANIFSANVSSNTVSTIELYSVSSAESENTAITNSVSGCMKDPPYDNCNDSHVSHDTESSCGSSEFVDDSDTPEKSFKFFVDKVQFLSDLRKLALDSNLTHASINRLLDLIIPAYPFLPRDARSLLHTPRSTETVTLNNGEMCYFGLKKCLIRKLKSGLAQQVQEITLSFNIDGLPLFKSSSTELWPILVRSDAFKNNTPFMVAAFCGVGKPQPLNQYLDVLIDELVSLRDNGFHYDGRTFYIRLGYFTCDAPARAILKMIKGHTSRYGCERCVIRTKTESRKLFYPANRIRSVRPRLDSDFLAEIIDLTHMKGKSPLLRLEIGMVTQFLLDSLHLIHYGVVKRLIVKRWIEGDRHCKLSRQNLASIDFNIQTIRPYVTRDFVRKPRTLCDVKRWKATEFRFFLLYAGPVVTFNILDDVKYRHFLLLHTAITILSNEKLISSYLDVAKQAVELFVSESAEIYDHFFVSYNIHSLLHACDDVEKYGPLENYSCFPFESYLNQIKRRVRSKQSPLQHISNRVAELDNMDAEVECSATSVIPRRVKYPHENANDYFECESLTYHDLNISTRHPDNVVAVGRAVYVIEQTFNIDGKYKYIGTPFRYVHSLYRYPIRSSKLGIYFARSYSGPATLFVDEISHKCMRFPFKNGFAIFPILHQIKI